MKYCEFNPSFGDAEYRRSVKEAIDYAKGGIEIIGTDLSSISYPEILYSLRTTRKEGPLVRIYFNNAPRLLIDWLKDSDIELYQGERRIADKEYIIIDGSKLVSSQIEDNARVGYLTMDVDEVQKYLALIESLLNDPATKQIASMENEVKERHVEIVQVSKQEIENRINEFDQLAEKISRAVKPERLEDLELSIRRDRERTL